MMRIAIPLSLLAVFAIAAPAQAADLWDYVPEVRMPFVIKGDVQGTECAPDDPICEITCTGAYFEDGYHDPEVDPQEKEAKVPGPGRDGSQVVLLGHWTICW